jgi:hypothetical protein
MYPFSAGYAYFGQRNDGDFIINPSLLVDNE